MYESADASILESFAFFMTTPSSLGHRYGVQEHRQRMDPFIKSIRVFVGSNPFHEPSSCAPFSCLAHILLIL